MICVWLRRTANIKLNTITKCPSSLTETIWKTCTIWFDLKTWCNQIQNGGNNVYWLFGSHRKTRFSKFWSHDQIYNIIWVKLKIFVDDVMGRNYDVKIFILKYLYMANIIKNAIMFMEKTFEQSTKIKRIIIFT